MNTSVRKSVCIFTHISGIPQAISYVLRRANYDTHINVYADYKTHRLPSSWLKGRCFQNLYSYGLYSHGPCSYGQYSYGLYSYGLYSYGLNNYGLYSYGLYSYGLCGYGTLFIERSAYPEPGVYVNKYISVCPAQTAGGYFDVS